MARTSGIPLDQCPTCLSKLEYHGDIWGRENGTYIYKGVEHDCDCETQIELRKHYLLANIGDQYQRLDWSDFRDEDVKTDVAAYLENWTAFKLQGMGIEFASPQLGTGKTFCATNVAKELIKRGERAYFIPFGEVLSLYQTDSEHRDLIENRLRDINILVLDEVVPPWTDAQGQFFASKFEEIIRHRTNFNRVTIVTTNLTEQNLRYHYPRPYSLLEAKQFRVVLEGEDARQFMVRNRNLDMAANQEVAPIT